MFTGRGCATLSSVTEESSDARQAARGRAPLFEAVLLKLAWGGTVAGALALMLRGLLAAVYFEPTGDALAEARWGNALVGVACFLLVAAAAYAVLGAGCPRWVGVGLLIPVVLCGGLTLIASQTLLPQLAVLVAYPLAVGSGVAGLITGPRRR